jgi:hypothetical protein
MKNKTYIQGFIDGIIEFYKILTPFDELQAFGYDVYEVNDKWLITFHYTVRDIASSESNPELDDSIQEFKSEPIKILKSESNAVLREGVLKVLDYINAVEVETER